MKKKNKIRSSDGLCSIRQIEMNDKLWLMFWFSWHKSLRNRKQVAKVTFEIKGVFLLTRSQKALSVLNSFVSIVELKTSILLLNVTKYWYFFHATPLVALNFIFYALCAFIDDFCCIEWVMAWKRGFVALLISIGVIC